MDIQNFKKLLFEKAKAYGFEKCEIYFSSGSSSEISVYKGETEQYKEEESGGFSFRGIYKGKMGYFFSEKTDEDILDTVVKNAAENALLSESEEKEDIFSGSEEYPRVNTYDEALKNVDVEEKTALALDAEKKAFSYDKRVEMVESSLVESGENSIYLANSTGLELKNKTNYVVAYISVTAKENESVKQKYDYYVGRDIEELKRKNIGEVAAKKAVASLNAKSVKSGYYPIIIENKTFADILSTFEGNFSGEAVNKGFSLLKGKLSQTIASPLLTLTDDPLLEGGMSSCPFDDEGVSCRKKNIIEEGVLKTFLHNIKTAATAGTQTTGNGFKANFKSTVGVSSTNLYIQKGKASFEELLKKAEGGILITDVTGLHSGANTVSGDFSLAAEGFLIEKGSLSSSVEQITIAGNFYELLKNVEAIGNDLSFNLSGVGSPSLFFPSIAVSGQ